MGQQCLRGARSPSNRRAPVSAAHASCKPAHLHCAQLCTSRTARESAPLTCRGSLLTCDGQALGQQGSLLPAASDIAFQPRPCAQLRVHCCCMRSLPSQASRLRLQSARAAACILLHLACAVCRLIAVVCECRCALVSKCFCGMPSLTRCCTRLGCRVFNAACVSLPDPRQAPASAACATWRAHGRPREWLTPGDSTPRL